MLDTPDKNSRNVKSFLAHSSRIDDVRSLSDLFTLQAALLRRVWGQLEAATGAESVGRCWVFGSTNTK